MLPPRPGAGHGARARLDARGTGTRGPCPWCSAVGSGPLLGLAASISISKSSSLPLSTAAQRVLWSLQLPPGHFWLPALLRGVWGCSRHMGKGLRARHAALLPMLPPCSRSRGTTSPRNRATGGVLRQQADTEQAEGSSTVLLARRGSRRAPQEGEEHPKKGKHSPFF